MKNAIYRIRYEYDNGRDDTYEETIDLTLDDSQAQHMRELSLGAACPNWLQNTIYTNVATSRGYENPSGFIYGVCAILGYQEIA
jgi:hypothetical protein